MAQARVAAYLVVPAITLAVAVALLLAFATPRTLIAVRLWGGPTEAGSQAVRLQCVRRAVGVEDGVPLGDLVLHVGSLDLPCSCDERGYGEVRIEHQGPGALSLRVRGRGAGGRGRPEGSIFLFDGWNQETFRSDTRA